jgi:succinate dehydrogenase/fumarate reductase cytochrome b subunit
MKWLRICIYVGGAFTIASHVGVTVLFLYYLTPRSGETWLSHYADPPFSMKPVLVALVFIAVVGLAIDIYLLVLPIAAIIQIHVPLRRKVWTILIFMTGILFVPFFSSLDLCLAEFRAEPALRARSLSIIESFTIDRPIKLGII